MIRQRLANIRSFKERETRRVFGLLLAGKMTAIIVLLGAIKAFTMLLDTPVGAAVVSPSAHKANDFVNPMNTVWVLVTAFLVFFMQAGFMALEAGFARSRESVNIMMECIFDTCLCGILWFAVGFAFMFGYGNGLIGHSFFFLHHTTPDYQFAPGSGTTV